MNMNICTVCNKPIVGFFTEVKKKDGNNEAVCLDCAKGITLWNLAMAGYAPIYPDVVAEIPVEGKPLFHIERATPDKDAPSVSEPVNDYKQDAEVMTWDDYCNKYADNPDALNYFVSRQS